MNRRDMLVSVIGILIPGTTFQSDELRAVNHQLIKNKQFVSKCGNTVIDDYKTDSIVIKMNDGSTAECWISNKNVLGCSGFCPDNNPESEMSLKRAEIAEEYARNYFNIPETSYLGIC